MRSVHNLVCSEALLERTVLPRRQSFLLGDLQTTLEVLSTVENSSFIIVEQVDSKLIQDILETIVELYHPDMLSEDGLSNLLTLAAISESHGLRESSKKIGASFKLQSGLRATSKAR